MDTLDHEAWRFHRDPGRYPRGYPGGGRTEIGVSRANKGAMQRTMEQFFPKLVRSDGSDGSDGSDDSDSHFDYLWEPGREKLTCSVYLYTCARTRDHAYVGQTIQEPRARDRQHRHGWQTVFDRSYVEDDQYTLVVLEQRVFEADIEGEADDRALHAKAQVWLDAAETQHIDYYQTYDPTGAGPGLNQTRGGQPGALVAYVQAARRESHRRWRELYAPGFEAWLVANRTSLLQVKHADTVPVAEAPDGILPIGKLVHNIRTGNTAVPAEWRAWLDERGFAWDYQAAMWERVYIPGFEAWQAANQTSLLHVKQADTVPVAEAPDGVLPLGPLVHNIRTGSTAVPAEWRAWLDERGFAWDYQAAMWERVYIPGFEAWLKANQTSLLHVKRAGTVPVAEAPDGILPIGKLVHNIRTGSTAVPAEWRAWLDERGLAWDYQAAMWERVYIPGFETWMEANQTSLLHVKIADTVPAPEARDGVLPIGKLVSHIRTGHTAVPAEWRAWLDERGFLWHTRCLATHVQRRLQRLKQQLPTTAPALARDAEVTSALSALYGTGSFGLASESLVELEARYLGDLARL